MYLLVILYFLLYDFFLLTVTIFSLFVTFFLLIVARCSLLFTRNLLGIINFKGKAQLLLLRNPKSQALYDSIFQNNSKYNHRHIS